MKVVIAGGTGFLGEAFQQYFPHYKFVILTRSPLGTNQVYWDAKTIGDWTTSLEGADALINLTGKSVDCRYNNRNRAIILNSRIDSTRILGQAIRTLNNPPKVWLNASSATTYIHSTTIFQTEEDGIIGDDFSMFVTKEWEKALFEFKDLSTRLIALRTSIVLGKGSAFAKLKQVSRLGMGGKQGNGQQFVSWIQIDDWCRALDFLIHNNNFKGPINITSPSPIRNEEFMRCIRKNLNIPFGLPSPVWLLEIASIVMQTETELILKSRNVRPKILLDNGFEFKYSEVEEAIQSLK